MRIFLILSRCAGISLVPFYLWYLEDFLIDFLKELPDNLKVEIGISHTDLKANYKIDLGERVVGFAIDTVRFLSTGRLNLGDQQQRKDLLKESEELKLIFGCIESKTRTNKEKQD